MRRCARRPWPGVGVDGAPFVIEQHVASDAGDDVCYHLVLDHVDSRAQLGTAPAPNLVILTDYRTAVGLLRGDTNAQHAIADGRMKIRGDLHEIARRLDALAGTRRPVCVGTSRPRRRARRRPRRPGS